jgi:hypothetical protein
MRARMEPNTPEPPVPPLEREAAPPSAWRVSVWLWVTMWCVVVLFLGTCGIVAITGAGADAY